MYKKVVFSVGGSILVPDEVDVKFIKGFSKLIKKYKKKIHFSIVVGGGRTARRYVIPGRKMGLNTKKAHEVGIAATHLNAEFVAELIDERFSKEHPSKIGKKKGLFVSGGYKVGWTTDTDAAYIAKSMKADVLVNVTDVKGVYTADPNKDPKAKFIPKMDWGRFFKMFGRKVVPSGHYVFDPIAGGICQRNKIKVVVLNNNLKNIQNLLKGKSFIGTTIE